MRLLRAIAALAVMAALSWSCARDATTGTGPTLRGSLSGSSSDDFDYIARPPYVQVKPGTLSPDAIPFCGTSSGPFICYSPKLVRQAYNYPSVSTLDGTGQTILLVDAFGSPTIAADLARFDQFFHLPAPPSFTVFCPQGCPAFAVNNRHGEVGWSIETSLDVEYAHAMAPGANIVLVVAATSSGDALNVAEEAAIERYPGSIMSQSFGIPEIVLHANNAQIMQAHQNYLAAQASGITVLASTGDFGASNGYGTVNAQFPASDPLVTAVGGTQGQPYPGGLAGCDLTTQTCAGSYGGEQVWNEPNLSSGPAAAGGAPSALFGVPAYQGGLGLTTRTVPDVSYNAAVNGGVIVRWSAVPASAGFYIVGGTSAAAPQWAAIVALANQKKGGALGFINPSLYQIGHCATSYGADFHDITVGDNQLGEVLPGFSAGTGWDDASGWGTPNVTNLVADLGAPPSC